MYHEAIDSDDNKKSRLPEIYEQNENDLRNAVGTNT